jgi:hypothetical protein
MSTDYQPPAMPGKLRVSADVLRQREYVPADRFVEREQDVATFDRSLIITDGNGDSWHVEALEGGGLRVISWAKNISATMVVMPEVSNVVKLRNVVEP